MSEETKEKPKSEEIKSPNKKKDENPNSKPAEQKSSKVKFNAEETYIKCKNAVLKSCPWLEKISVFLKNCGFPDMLMIRLIAVFFFFSGLNIYEMRNQNIYADSQWVNFVQNIDMQKSIFYMVIGFIVLTIIHWIVPKKLRFSDHILAVAAILYFNFTLLWKGMNLYLCISFAIVSVILVNYIIGTFKKEQIKSLCSVPSRICGITVLVSAIFVGTVMSIFMILRDKCFETQCFDMGIFIQMYDHMAEDLKPITTCERDFEISHFKIHASFILYLLLPFYKIFSSPVTLHIAHSVLVMGGVIPLFLIAKKREIKGIPLIGICLAYCFSVGVTGPLYYFFHENSFMPTLLMWLLWAVDNKKISMFYIMSSLVCIVKEDAPLFVICIGMYMFFEYKGEFKRIHGIIVSLLSGIYMMSILNYLTNHGDGQSMSSSRFGHLMIDTTGGMTEVVKNSLSDPAYLISMLFNESTVQYLLAIMLPLLFVPLFTKKIHRYLLMMPFIITNLVIGFLYSCAADVGFQYTLGPVTMLIYLAAVNVSEMEESRKQRLPILMAVASIIMTFGTQTKYAYCFNTYKNNKDGIAAVDEMLDSIPQDASVLCDPYYVPHAAQRDEIYLFDFYDVDQSDNSLIDAERYDFIAVPVNSDLNKTLRPYFDQNGYTIYDEVVDRLVVYQSPYYEN